MPSKLRKAIGAVKDQTSISLAKVSTTSNLDVAILKATSHEELPVEDRYVNEILLLTSSNKIYAAACAQALAKRIGRTHNWIVALKSLMIVLRVFQDGDPYFPKEVLITMKRGGKILNLANFRDDYNSSPWDYTAFVRTVALYLGNRLDLFITGKLQRRMVVKERDHYHYHPHKQRYNEHVRDMKPAVLLDKVTHWQQLLDRAIGTRPTGAAKTNRLVQISLYAIVRESFDIYRDISDGLTLLIDSFFHMPHQLCIAAYDACVRSSKQFDELNCFYKVCREIGVGRSSEYPTVQKISEELMETLQEFLKDKSSFPDKPQTSPHLRLPPPSPSVSSRRGYSEYSDALEQFDGRSFIGSEPHHRQKRVSLEDLISVTEPGTSPSFCIDLERRSAQLQASSSVEDFQSVDTPGTSPGLSTDRERNNEYSGKPSPIDDLISLHTPGTSPPTSIDQRDGSWIIDQERRTENSGNRSPIDDLLSLHTAGTSSPASIDQRNGNSVLDLCLLDDPVQPYGSQPSISGSRNEWELVLAEPSVSGDVRSSSRNEWELVLAETANMPSIHNSTSYNQASTSYDQSNYNNPFLTLGNELSLVPVSTVAPDPFSTLPTFQEAPTFCAQNPNETRENDMFNSPMSSYRSASHVTMSQPHLIREQQLWLQNQTQIITKHRF